MFFHSLSEPLGALLTKNALKPLRPHIHRKCKEGVLVCATLKASHSQGSPRYASHASAVVTLLTRLGTSLK